LLEKHILKFHWIWIWIIIANLLTDISAMECARLRAWSSMQTDHRWLLKDDTEANEVMESGNEFHSVKFLQQRISETELKHNEVS